MGRIITPSSSPIRDGAITDLRAAFLAAIEPRIRQEFRGWSEYANWVMSWQGLARFAREIKNPDASILDCGAGASSFCLRKLFKNVFTVDSNNAYLRLVKEICVLGRAGGRNFIHGLENAPPCDYVLYDYDVAPERSANLEAAWDRTGILMYIDDADDRKAFRKYREAVISWAADGDIAIEECRDAIDRFGRWGMLARKNVEPKLEKTKKRPRQKSKTKRPSRKGANPATGSRAAKGSADKKAAAP